jgi:hypothetical protein
VVIIEQASANKELTMPDHLVRHFEFFVACSIFHISDPARALADSLPTMKQTPDNDECWIDRPAIPSQLCPSTG